MTGSIAGYTGRKDNKSLLSRLLRYGGTFAVLSATTALFLPFREDIGLLNVGLVYMVAIIGATLFAGRLAGVLASVSGFILLNFFFVPPYLTFDVTGHNNILTLFVFLGVSLLISTLISGAREQAEQAHRRAEDVSRLYELSQTIIAARRIDDVLPALASKVVDVFNVQACWLLLPDAQDTLVVRALAPEDARLPVREEMAQAEWVFRHGSGLAGSGLAQAGNRVPGFKNQPSSGRCAFVPLRAANRIIGVLAVMSKLDSHSFTGAEWTVLATFADQAAVALDRFSLLKEAERAEVLARTDDLKSALMSAVSHDLRTPLASITASVTSLMEPDIEWDDETRRDFLQGIYDEARRLNRLVGNLLDMSRIEGGALHPEKDWYSISEVIGAVVQRLEHQLSNHPLTVLVDDGIPLLLLDFAQIDQVLTNLLENAVRHTPPNTPIKMEAQRKGDDVQVSIADSGSGVPSEHLPHLFDKFYRVPAGRKNGRENARRTGTGLGLAISRGLVEAHGGRVWAGNVPGGGLQVTFTLPLVRAEEAGGENHEVAIHKGQADA
ncbi:MAG: ATP-binding protein [Chloroflexota bacterium]